VTNSRRAGLDVGVATSTLTRPTGGGTDLPGKFVPPPPNHPPGAVACRTAEAGGRSVGSAADPAIRDLEECYRTLSPLVRSYLRRYVPSSDVDDVLQVVFYEVWRSRSRYDPAQSMRGWVLGIARKKAIDHLRKRRDKVVPIDLIAELVGDDGREYADRFAWAEEMSAHLSNLTDGQRQVIVMAYYERRTQAEIAAELNIPLGTVKTRTRRGLQRLAELLTEPHTGTAAHRLSRALHRGPAPGRSGPADIGRGSDDDLGQSVVLGPPSSGRMNERS
jgi:RNA polymerase sigma factor (sigma-70 family)